MRYSIILSRDAEKDLGDIFEYIAFVLQAPENAAGQLDRLEQGIASLEKMPEGGIRIRRHRFSAERGTMDQKIRGYAKHPLIPFLFFG